MSETTEIGGVEIPLDALETLVERFDRDEIPEGSGAGVTTNLNDRGDTFGLFDDADVDNAVRLKNLSEESTSSYQMWGRFKGKVDEAFDPDPEPGVYLRGVEDAGDYGFEVPIDGDYVVEKTGTSTNPYTVAWDTDSDVSDLRSAGSGCSLAVDHGFDGYAVVEDLEIVEYE